MKAIVLVGELKPVIATRWCAGPHSCAAKGVTMEVKMPQVRYPVIDPCFKDRKYLI
jgi:hypothetical protein